MNRYNERVIIGDSVGIRLMERLSERIESHRGAARSRAESRGAVGGAKRGSTSTSCCWSPRAGTQTRGTFMKRMTESA